MKKFKTFSGDEEIEISKTATSFAFCNNNNFFISKSNEPLLNTLNRNVKFNHLCHSYLFLGDEGIGKFTVAINLAAAILCKNPTDGKPCFNCTSCKKILSDNHPDLTVIEGTGSANSIHIETIRAIRTDAYLQPNESLCKIFIIKNAEEMSISAFNSLLKVLEEPPKSALFILTAKSKDSLPSTIISRCIPFTMYPFSNDEISNAIMNLQEDFSTEQINNAVEQSNGIIGRAMKILTTNDDVSEIKDGIINGLVSLNEYEILKSLSNVKKDKILMVELLQELTIIMRNILLQKVSQSSCANSKLNMLANQLTVKKIEKIVSILQEATEKIGTNINIPLLTNWLCEQL
ncbi:MAG: DNA polymerase III subunit, partial [Oscillospiraceae bacterium]